MILRHASCLAPKSLCPLSNLRMTMPVLNDVSLLWQHFLNQNLEQNLKNTNELVRAGQMLSRLPPENPFTPLVLMQWWGWGEIWLGMLGTLGAFSNCVPSSSCLLPDLLPWEFLLSNPGLLKTMSGSSGGWERTENWKKLRNTKNWKLEKVQKHRRTELVG